MPTPMIKKVAKKLGRSIKSVEKDWEQAKKDADYQGYGLITHIFKKRLGKKALKKIGWKANTLKYVELESKQTIEYN